MSRKVRGHRGSQAGKALWQFWGARVSMSVLRCLKLESVGVLCNFKFAGQFKMFIYHLFFALMIFPYLLYNW